VAYSRKGAPVAFKVLGDERLSCRMVIVRQKEKLPGFKVLAKEEVKGKSIKEATWNISLTETRTSKSAGNENI
jgi:hypothetical protein